MGALIEVPAGSTALTTTHETTTATLMNIIQRAAFDPTVDIARLEMLFQMQREVLADEAKVAFEAAMARVQSEMLPIVRSSENKQNNTRFAKLEQIDAEIRPIYTRHGFSLSFTYGDDGNGGKEVRCDVGHNRGHIKQYKLPWVDDSTGLKGNTNKTPIMALGSTITFLRRILTCMAFNVTLTNEESPVRAEQRFISESMKEILVGLLKETGVDTVRFLQSGNLTSLDMMLRSDYPSALRALEKTKAEMAKATQSNG